MNEGVLELSAPMPAALPEPRRERWQPLRLGLVELFHYDSEEFWFHDGHLLLRGNNGTGKSKVLSLTLPLLFDANLRPSRIEPDGDPGKRMAWNLLMNSYPRRMGYTWIEFGRRAADGTVRYLTLGAGLSAVAARAQVESWFFILEHAAGGPRVGRDLWFTSSQRVVHTRERLRDAIEGRGQIFETAAAYRRAVDERLFHLGARRYDAMVDTLIQLRQPQLSRKPDEAGLSHALTEALPPMPQELLSDVAEALNQLEEDRRQLEDLKALAKAVERFEQRYRVYTGMLSRRQARALRQAQTDFDNASQERNHAQTHLQEACTAEDRAAGADEQAERNLAAQRSRHDTLQSDPTMQDANRLAGAERDAEKRRHAVRKDEDACTQARARLAREEAAGRQSLQRAAQAEAVLHAMRNECSIDATGAGLAQTFSDNPLVSLVPSALAELALRGFEAATVALRGTVTSRREQLTLLKRRHDELQRANQVLIQQQSVQREHQAELEDAGKRRAAADSTAEHAGQMLVEAWERHCADLVELGSDYASALSALSEWVVRPEGENPARLALLQTSQQVSLRHAARQIELQSRREALREERTALEAEAERLRTGYDTEPPAPHTRAPLSREAIAGAPFWQLVDFQAHVDAGARAGLEAALEAAGLLDAWITPAGELLAGEQGKPWFDRQWLLRPPMPSGSLTAWLCAAVPAESSVPASTIERLLASVACGANDEAEAWVAPDGRFRLGTLTGAWNKPLAVYIGQAARAAARRHRLEAIGLRLEELALAEVDVARQLAQIEAGRRQAAHEHASAPSEEALHQALLEVSACEREFQAARVRLERSESLCREAELRQQAMREILQRDAIDMRLPMEPDALSAVEETLYRFNDAQYRLTQAAQEWRRAHPEMLQQRIRESEAKEQLQRHEAQLAASRLEADEAQARFEVLRETVGTQVENLRRQLGEARRAVQTAEEAWRAASEERRRAAEARARASAIAEAAEQRMTQRSEARTLAVTRLQHFAASSLLSAALPTLELPDLAAAWTIDPALTLARRVEQALCDVQDDEVSWTRVQRQVAEDLQELQSSLSALGHHAPAETSDWGFVVHIVFHNRAQRPDELAARLADDIAQRTELLSAHERTILENHLQTEIASEVQRLLRSAEQQVQAINSELHKRPTSTGVRYRLRWEPLGDDEGAPIGLTEARGRLLHTTADLWSGEDRRVVGTMLQQRIAAERERADADPGGSAEDRGSLIEHLARALDYRRWHRFRVERLQDGQWRKLSGPASSGERALGLTVPLFAAVASFYSQGSNPHAPRLMLLDEAFAGIDDAARAHCMGLIREFDLDFVITSEREWGCYAELPGVSICQLQRREGIDAVFVSRWTWDGRAKRREDDPNRRFAPA